MDKITVDEKNKLRIKKYIKSDIEFKYGYEQDIALLEQNSELTEKLAEKIFTRLMIRSQSIRDILEPKENDEFREQIEETFSKFDKIPKPSEYETYGYYDNAYRDMELEEIYANMQTCLEVRELDDVYYRCRDLREIANTVINSIDGIERYKIEIQPEAEQELKKLQAELRVLLNAERTDMEGIQNRIDIYNNHAMSIWNNYLTNVNDNTQDNEFRYVVHNLTKGALEGDFRTKYMSTSLITNNAMGLFGASNYGLIIKPKHIVSASHKDTFTYNYREDGEELFNIRPPIKLPQEIEETCVEQTIEANGEMLNYDIAQIYSEIVVDDYEIEGMYYISNGEHELARNYERARKMAEERGLTLKELDISQIREEKGLEPMTDKMKREFCQNILYNCCNKDEILLRNYMNYNDTFIQTYYQEFADRYMQLRAKEGYSEEDILGIFAEIAEKDLHFSKIAENIRENQQKEETEQADLPKQERTEENAQSEMSEYMKKKEEIENLLGIKIESKTEEQTRDSSYAINNEDSRYVSRGQQDYTVKVKVLPKETAEALKKLLKDYVSKGDLETAATCHSILQEESTFYRTHPNAIGLDFEQGTMLFEYEQEQKALAEQASIKAEQEISKGVRTEVKEKTKQEEVQQEAKAEGEQVRAKVEQEAGTEQEEVKEDGAEQAQGATINEFGEIIRPLDNTVQAIEQENELVSQQKVKADSKGQVKIVPERIQQEYGLNNITDINTLQERLMHTVSDGIQYGASQSAEGVKRLEEIKQVVPQFEEFKRVYLKLRLDGLEDKLYESIDLKTVSYAELLNRANLIISEAELKREQIKHEESTEKITKIEQQQQEDSLVAEQGTKSQQEQIPTSTVDKKEKTKAETQEKTYTEPSIEEHLQFMESIETQIAKQVNDTMEEYWNSWDKTNEADIQMQEKNNSSVDLWMNRFNSWYTAIDRVSQSAKAKFVQMKSDIVKVIGNVLKERSNQRQEQMRGR